MEWKTTIITATATGCYGPNYINTYGNDYTNSSNAGIYIRRNIYTMPGTAVTITYTAASTNNTSITYTLDATSISGGNSINSSTGAVTYTAGWTGTSTITATASGCNGPKTATHTATITPTVGTPVFALGP